MEPLMRFPALVRCMPWDIHFCRLAAGDFLFLPFFFYFLIATRVKHRAAETNATYLLMPPAQMRKQKYVRTL